MEMNENGQKKMLLSVLGVAILIVAVIGISFAVYSTSFAGQVNTVTTGTIMVSYAEPSNAIYIDDAMPLSNANGIALTGANKTFAFTVSTKADNALTVPYTITLTKDTATSTLLDTQVKVYLTKGGTAVDETSTPQFVNDLTTSTITGRTTSKVLHTDSDVFTASDTAAKTSSYVLRMWIADTVNYDDITGKEYHAKVNVDSAVAPLS